MIKNNDLNRLVIVLSDHQNSYIVKNLYPLYLHDLAGHFQNLPNIHGVFEEDQNVKTLMDQFNIQQIWWEKPGILFPYLIYYDDIPAGFCFVSTPPYTSENIDFQLYEFFVIRPLRNIGLGKKVFAEILTLHKGKWELHTDAKKENQHAQNFWTKTIIETFGQNYQCSTKTLDCGNLLVFNFSNSDV